MAEKTGSNVFDLVRGTFWPVVGLVITFAFYSPIYKIFEAVSSRAASIQKIKLGELELNIKVTDLPVPTTETAKVLPKFSEGMIVGLVTITGDAGGPCFDKGATRANDSRLEAFSALADLRLIEFVKAAPSSICEVSYNVKLTSDGKATRKFLMDLLATQITRSREADKQDR